MAAPLGNRNRATAHQVNQVLLEEARKDRWDLVRRAVRAQLQEAAAGSLASTAWVFDRLAGKPMPMPMLPDVDSDRAVSITWSFGPAAVEHQPAQPIDSIAQSSLEVEDASAREVEGR